MGRRNRGSGGRNTVSGVTSRESSSQGGSSASGGSTSPVGVGKLLRLEGGVDSDVDGSSHTLGDVVLVNVDNVDNSSPSTVLASDVNLVIVVLGSLVPGQGVLAVWRDSRQTLTDGVLEEELTSVVSQTSSDKSTVVGLVTVATLVGTDVDVDGSADVPSWEDGVKGNLTLRVGLSNTSQEGVLVSGAGRHAAAAAAAGGVA